VSPPSNQRLQLALRRTGPPLRSVVSAVSVGAAVHEFESLDQLRRSFLTAPLKR